MLPKIKIKKDYSIGRVNVFLINNSDNIEGLMIPNQVKALALEKIEETPLKLIEISNIKETFLFVLLNDDLEANKQCEKLRRIGFEICQLINKIKAKNLNVFSTTENYFVLSLVEGVALSNYQFLKYFSDAEKRKNTLEKVEIFGASADKNQLQKLTAKLEGNFIARDLVNEPLSYLTAEQLSEDIKALGEVAGFKVEVFNKKKIESLKMGGLLAVNKGTPNPPTFNILEYKSAKAKNSKPIVFVGKGVVYDTGGISLKPTQNSMDFMKSDMGGAAAVIGAIYAIAKANLPVHVIALVPATENRPDGLAYVPGDIVKMFNGITVEVLNTDAEGRMILADALSYALKYKPELCIDVATLTGAASLTVSDQAIVAMGTAPENTFEKLEKSGFNVQERLAKLPFFDEYGEYIKSEIADLKNIGGPYAGSITAGKFLEHFTKEVEGDYAYPWIHLDIAGPAFLKSADSYRGKNASGVGARLLFDFIENY